MIVLTGFAANIVVVVVGGNGGLYLTICRELVELPWAAREIGRIHEHGRIVHVDEFLLEFKVILVGCFDRFNYLFELVL